MLSLLQPNVLPEYGRGESKPASLDPFKPYLEERMRAGVWNAFLCCARKRIVPIRELLPTTQFAIGTPASEGW
jgi:hypothetical protein